MLGKKPEDEALELVRSYLDGDLGLEGMDGLEKVLERRPELAVDLARLEMALSVFSSTSPAGGNFEPPPGLARKIASESLAAPSPRRFWRTAAAGIAAAALVLAAIWGFSGHRKNSGPKEMNEIRLGTIHYSGPGVELLLQEDQFILHSDGAGKRGIDLKL